MMWGVYAAPVPAQRETAPADTADPKVVTNHPRCRTQTDENLVLEQPQPNNSWIRYLPPYQYRTRGGGQPPLPSHAHSSLLGPFQIDIEAREQGSTGTTYCAIM
jgi:hypothetical protein